MKKCLLFLIVPFLNSGYSYSQSGEWTWLHGISATNPSGSFGTQGVSGPFNVPPGLYEPCEWTDQSGNFWMFGGWAVPGISLSSALWKYNPATNEWTWMKGPSINNDPGNYGVQGISAASNNPPSRGHGAASWIDAQGNFWMFGGQTLTGNLSDLWKYDPGINEWTWVKGPNALNQFGTYGVQGIPSAGNNPGSRYECVAAWTDGAGDLWIFGGITGGAVAFNDLWRYTIVSNMWTWMKGSNLPNQLGNYGTLGVEAPANNPGSRESHNHWIDNSGNFWLFGGQKIPSPYFSFNDLWRFNPVTNNWTWMNGTSLPDQPATYGTQCLLSPVNTPGARFEMRSSWKDQAGDFWLYGGGLTPLCDSIWSDLWKYCVSINEWVWIEGDQVSGAAGNWGTLGVSSPFNKPDGRVGAIGWTDNNGHLYMFGGGNPTWFDRHNDLWKYTIDAGCAPCSNLPIAGFSAPNTICPGTCTDFTNLSYNAVSYQWFFPGSTGGTSSDVNPQGICYNIPGIYDVTLIAVGTNGNDTLVMPNYITVYPQSPPQAILQIGDSLFSNQGFVTYQWYFNGAVIPGATSYFYLAQVSGNYNVVCTDTNACELEAAIFDVVAGLTPALSEAEGIWVFPNPVSEKLYVLNYPLNDPVEIKIYNVLGKLLMTAGPEISIDVGDLSPGFYLVEMREGEKFFRSNFIKQ